MSYFDLQFPLSNDGKNVRMALIRMPDRTITETEWNRLMEILNSMKDGLVGDKNAKVQ